jgi:hypothetical protein
MKRMQFMTKASIQDSRDSEMMSLFAKVGSLGFSRYIDWRLMITLVLLTSLYWLFEQSDRYPASQEIACFSITQRFVIVLSRFTNGLCRKPVQPSSYLHRKSLLILSSRRRLVSPTCLFPWRLETCYRYALLVFHMRATCPANFVPFHLITL